MNALLTQGRRCFNALLQGLLALLGRGWRPQAAGPVTRIIVIELTRLGDVCAASSLFRPLRQAYPQATLEAVVQAPYAPLLETELNKVHGIAGQDDFGIAKDLRLVISRDAELVLRGFNLSDATFEAYP